MSASRIGELSPRAHLAKSKGLWFFLSSFFLFAFFYPATFSSAMANDSLDSSRLFFWEALSRIESGFRKLAPPDLSYIASDSKKVILADNSDRKFSDPATLDQLKGQFTVRYAGRSGLIGNYKHLAFFDDFKVLAIGRDEDSANRFKWFSPGHTSYGFAKFPSITELPANFNLIDGALHLRLQKSDETWYGADIVTTNRKGEGFTFRNGYVEASIKAAQGVGGWSAFWMTSLDSPTTGMHAEIDIIESYGGASYGYNSSIHLWPGSQPPTGASRKHWAFGVYPKIPVAADDKFHVYGCELTDDLIVFYIDGQETSRVVRAPEWSDGPWRIFLTLAGGPKEYVYKAISPNDMIVEYVKAWTN